VGTDCCKQLQWEGPDTSQAGRQSSSPNPGLLIEIFLAPDGSVVGVSMDLPNQAQTKQAALLSNGHSLTHDLHTCRLVILHVLTLRNDNLGVGIDPSQWW